MADAWTEVNVAWKGESAFIGQNAAGGTVQMGTLDGKPGVGPMSLLLVAIAGCTGIDIVDILKKKRLEIHDLQIKVQGNRAEDFPKIWKEIHLEYRIWGNDIPAKAMEQAIELSETKYCSVGIMLGKSARITHEYHIYKPGETAG